MDRKDRYILESLIKNARVPYAKMASELGITEAAVRKRVRKLEENGVIQGYTAIVEPMFLGFDAVAIIGVDTKPEVLFEVYEKIKNLKPTRYVAFSSGDHMMIVKAWCENRKELARFIRKIERMRGVTRVCPAILLKRLNMAERE